MGFPPQPTPADYYWEYVHETIDGVVEDILSGALNSQVAVNEQLHKVLEASVYVTNVESSAVCLRASKHPTYGLVASIMHDPSLWRQGPLKDDGTDPFPWADLALAALKMDVFVILGERNEYIQLSLMHPHGPLPGISYGKKDKS